MGVEAGNLTQVLSGERHYLFLRILASKVWETADCSEQSHMLYALDSLSGR